MSGGRESRGRRRQSGRPRYGRGSLRVDGGRNSLRRGRGRGSLRGSCCGCGPL